MDTDRSQMAEAFARLHGGGRVDVYRAGSRSSGRINPKAMEAMRELGYDLGQHRSKSLSEGPDIEYEAVVANRHRETNLQVFGGALDGSEVACRHGSAGFSVLSGIRSEEGRRVLQTSPLYNHDQESLHYIHGMRITRTLYSKRS